MKRFFASFATVAITAALHAQAPPVPQGAAQPGPPAPRAPMPARDGVAAEAPTGTARIRGRVVAADTGAPLRRAQVRLAAAELRITRSATTDAEGIYEFTELPAGRYNIFVTRSGFVSLQFGQRRPFESGRPLDVGNAQFVEKIDFALPRGGVIAGRMTDELGEPLAGVRMQAMRYQYLPSGQRQLAPVGGGGFFGGIATNDLGEFRLYSLMPGTYIVSAAPAETGGMMVSPGGPASAQNDSHGITYYPGTINVDEAQAITVGIAEVATASFALVPQRMTRISGLVRDSEGKPLAANISLRTVSAGGGGMMMRGLAMASADGRFSVASVPPGEHFIEVSPRPGADESASVPITAGGQDITDLIITTTRGKTISGEVTIEGAPAGLKFLRVNASSPDPGGPQPTRIYDDMQGTVDENGRFQIRGLSGRAIFNAFPAIPGGGPPALFLKSVMIDGENFTDIPFDVSNARDDTKIQIVMTDKQTTLSGTVTNARGDQVIDYTAVMFPAQFKEGVLAARYIRAVRPDQQGRFQARGLPPGDYFAVAVESLEQGGHFDPAFRKQLEPSAKRFTLTEGQTATVDLVLAE